MTTVNTETGEIVEGEIVEELTATEARELTDQIRQTLRIGHDLIVRAYRGRAWLALGYASWDDYCAGEFNEARMVRLDREQRREIVAEMHRAGMSNRAIASGIGVDYKTVMRDAQLVQDGPVAIQGLDGRARQNKRVVEKPQRRKPVEPATDRSPAGREQRALLIEELAAQGYSSRQMPAKVGVTEETVRLIAREYDIEIPADRSMSRTRRINSDNLVVNTATALEGLLTGVELIDYDDLSPQVAAEWAAPIKDALRVLNRFAKQVCEVSG